MAVVLDNACPHLSTTKELSGRGPGEGEQHRTPLRAAFHGSWLNRIEAQLTALHYFALDGTPITATASRPA